MTIGNGMPRSQSRMPRPMMNLLKDHSLFIVLRLLNTAVDRWFLGIGYFVVFRPAVGLYAVSRGRMEAGRIVVDRSVVPNLRLPCDLPARRLSPRAAAA